MGTRLNLVGLHLEKRKNVLGSAGDVGCARDAGMCGLCQGCGNVWGVPGMRESVGCARECGNV